MAMNGHNLFDYDDGLNRTLVLGSATHDELLINSSLYRDLYKSKSETVERLNQSYSDFIALQKKLLEFQNQPVVPVPAHVAPAAAPTPPRRHDQPATRPDHLPASVLWTRADLEGKNKPARSDVAINSDGEKLPANSQFFKQLKTVEDGVKADLRTALSRLGHTTTEQQLPFLGVTELAKSHPELYQNAVSTFESDTILGPVLSLCADHWKSKAIFVWTLENLRKQIKPKAVAKVEKVEPEEDKAEKEELQLSAEKDGEIKKDAAARAQGDQEGRVVDGAAAAVALKPKNPSTRRAGVQVPRPLAAEPTPATASAPSLSALLARMESTACLDGQEIVPLVQRLSTDLQKLEVEDAPALASRNANLDGLLTKLLNWTPSAPNHSDDDEDAEHDSTIWIGHGQLDWVFPHITSALASWNDCSQGRDLAAIINALFAAVVSAEAVLRARGVDRSIVPSHLLLKLQAVLDDALALTREQLQQAKSTSSGLGGAARLEPMVGGAGAAEPAAGTESNLEKAATTVGKEDATAAADKGAAGTGVGAGGAVPSGVKRGAEKQVAGVAGPVAAEPKTKKARTGKPDFTYDAAEPNDTLKARLLAINEADKVYKVIPAPEVRKLAARFNITLTTEKNASRATLWASLLEGLKALDAEQQQES